MIFAEMWITQRVSDSRTKTSAVWQ